MLCRQYLHYCNTFFQKIRKNVDDDGDGNLQHICNCKELEFCLMVICTKVLELNEFHFGTLNFMVPKHDIGGTS